MRQAPPYHSALYSSPWVLGHRVPEEVSSWGAEIARRQRRFKLGDFPLTNIPKPLIPPLWRLVAALEDTENSLAFVDTSPLRGSPRPGNAADLIRYLMANTIDDEELSALETTHGQTFWRAHRKMHLRHHSVTHDETMRAILRYGVDSLFDLLGPAAAAIAPEGSTPSPLEVPLIYLLPDPGKAIEAVLDLFLDAPFQQTGLLENIGETLQQNIDRVSRIKVSYVAPMDRGLGKEHLRPTKSDLSPEEMVSTYLADTPLKPLFSQRVPIKWERKLRYAHHHILGGSGKGKTTLLTKLILDDIRAPDKPSVVVIDPHSDLIRAIAHADLGIEDRIVIIDPRDIDHPPAINIFEPPKRASGRIAQNRARSNALKMLTFVLSELTEMALTKKQGLLFKAVASAMLSVPEVRGENATFDDLFDILAPDGSAKFRDVIAVLPNQYARFFRTHYDNNRVFGPTREEVLYKLMPMTMEDSLNQLFQSKTTKLDLASELDRGAIILIDTAEGYQKDGSGPYGKLMLSFILQAVLDRLEEGALRHPTFVYVDEAHNYFSSNVGELLRNARKVNVGLVLAHQDFSATPDTLRTTIAGNSEIKFASTNAPEDAAYMAKAMGTSSEFVLKQPAYHWAAHLGGEVNRTLSLSIQASEALPQLSQARYELMLRRNRERISEVGSAPPTPPSGEKRPGWWAARNHPAAAPSPQPESEPTKKTWKEC